MTDGAFFNAGQSCCGIKRIYVAQERYDEFIAGVVDLTHTYRLGSPLDPETTLGPVVRTAAAEAVRAQVREAVAARGARRSSTSARFAAAAPGTPYLAPQVLTGVDHSMAIMREETFGPAVGIMKVASDEEAVRLMNDSEFGLTAAIFSADAARAEALGDALETGTVFLNRCDYLDPALAWTGVKNSGRGCTLSRVGFEQLTRPKSYHFRVNDMSTSLRGNWNYPTTIWAGPGRIAELADACARAGIKRPLIVTDEGLVAAPMIENALAALEEFRAVRRRQRQPRPEARRGRPARVQSGESRRRRRVRRRIGARCGQGRRLHVGTDAAAVGFRGHRRLVDPRGPRRHRPGGRRAHHRRHRLRSRPRGRHPQRGDPSEEDHLSPADDAARSSSPIRSSPSACRPP